MADDDARNTLSSLVRDRFLKENAFDYGYGNNIDKMVEQEFGHTKEVVYLDHVGSALYSKYQIENHMAELKQSVYGNPHSGNSCSQKSSYALQEARHIVAKHFNTTLEKHHVIFTSGATAALKLVGESFRWKQESSFLYLDDSHTSVVGMREIVKKTVASFSCITEKHVKDVISKRGQSSALLSCSNCFNTDQEAKIKLVEKHEKTLTHDNSSHKTSYSHLSNDEQTSSNENQNQSEPYHLFSYPAMSNFCGRKYPLSWIKDVQAGLLSPLTKSQGRCFVLLDTASFVSTNTLDLSKVSADFVVVSFYKMFGFPTGVGALIVRADAADSLSSKSYYGGGTVLSTISSMDHHVGKESISERFEDGTVSFLSIMALKHGFDALKSLTGSMEGISKHTFSLARYTYSEMKSLKHANGQNLCKIYCDTQFEDSQTQGPIINFNLLYPDNTYIGYSQVERLANLLNIQLRTGCFCNTGACQKHLCLTSEDVLANFKAGHVCGDDMDVINGKPTGSVRISFGYMSTFDDVQTFLDFLKGSFMLSHKEIGSSIDFGKPKKLMDDSEQLQISANDVAAELNNNNVGGFWSSISILKQICLFPVKSCAGMVVDRWWVSETGLLYDREWMIVNEHGMLLTQKREPRLVFIKPSIDLEQNALLLQCEGHGSVLVSLECNNSGELELLSDAQVQAKICGDRVYCNDSGEYVASWLSDVLGQSCRLLRRNTLYPRMMKKALSKSGYPSDSSVSKCPQLTLANESQYLLISESSLAAFESAMTSKDSSSERRNLLDSFRANFVIQGNVPFQENGWTHVRIGNCDLKVAGGCKRCQMICINQKTAEKTKAPLETLIKLRGSKMEFGIYLSAKSQFDEEITLAVGDAVFCK